ncbi:MAG: hexokinase [Treponema sp.]|nr:hexokinase [Treponema sp.]
MSTKFNPDALNEFARYHGFHYGKIDPIDLLQDCLLEMERGLRGSPSSLPMIPAYISPQSKLEPGKTVLALDAGGTNLRGALVKFDAQGKAIPGESRRAPMPGTEGPLSAEAFFDGIAAVAAPLIEASGEKVEGIGFCFSYNMDITEEADGILRAFSKEVEAPDVIGKHIGAGLREALVRRNCKVPDNIILLNDTVATLLSGLAGIPAPGGHWQGEDRFGTEGGPMVGFILGTGLNTAYPEKRIPKIGFDSPQPQIVVVESGGFAHRCMGPLDLDFDRGTRVPGAHTLEKLSAGGYLGPLSFHILRQAHKEGLLVFKRADEFFARPSLEAKDISAFMNEPFSQKGPIAELFAQDEGDAISSMGYLIALITQRAGLMAASVTAAAAVKATEAYNNPRNLDPFVPVRIAVEGTTYLQYKGLREATEAYLQIMLTKDGPRTYTIAPVEQASLFGAAVAALSK